MLNMTQAELARALEVSPVTLNRWENDDPRYKPSDKDVRLLEALQEIVDTHQSESWKRELRDVLRVSTVAGVVGKAAVERVLKVTTITLLAATPGLGWLGVIAGIGVGAALPFFERIRSHAAATKASQTKPAVVPTPRAAPLTDTRMIRFED
jgi:transcriptional regulator with XRE-family HTH domain